MMIIPSWRFPEQQTPGGVPGDVWQAPWRGMKFNNTTEQFCPVTFTPKLVNEIATRMVIPQKLVIFIEIIGMLRIEKLKKINMVF